MQVRNLQHLKAVKVYGDFIRYNFCFGCYKSVVAYNTHQNKRKYKAQKNNCYDKNKNHLLYLQAIPKFFCTQDFERVFVE